MTPRIVAVIAAGLVVLSGANLVAGHFRAQGRAQVQARWDAEAIQRHVAENAAILNRIKNNERLAEQQALDKQQLKVNYEKELATVRAAAAIAGRMRVSAGFCAGFTSATQTDGAGRSDSGIAATIALPETYARDIDTLMLEADEIVASCRVAQEYLKKTGQAP